MGSIVYVDRCGVLHPKETVRCPSEPCEVLYHDYTRTDLVDRSKAIDTDSLAYVHSSSAGIDTDYALKRTISSVGSVAGHEQIM